MDRVAIIIGLSLLIAGCFSFLLLEAYGQEDIVKLDCPKNAYHGLDNQGNEACRDIQTNQILEPESMIITNPETGETILNNEQTQIEIIILALVGIIAVIGVSAKKGKFEIFQRQGWSRIQKEQVRNRQYGKCNMCFNSPSKWKYDHIDANKSNNDLYNCQGLCPECHSIKTERDIRLSIYQKSD